MTERGGRDEIDGGFDQAEVDRNEKRTHVRRKLGLFTIGDTDQTWVLFLAVGFCIIHRGVFAIMRHYGHDERLQRQNKQDARRLCVSHIVPLSFVDSNNAVSCLRNYNNVASIAHSTDARDRSQ